MCPGSSCISTVLVGCVLCMAKALVLLWHITKAFCEGRGKWHMKNGSSVIWIYGNIALLVTDCGSHHQMLLERLSDQADIGNLSENMLSLLSSIFNSNMAFSSRMPAI